MTACVCCGRMAEEQHHIKPASRRPDLSRDEANLVPVCQECHLNLTAYRWRVQRVGEFWHTVDAATGEVLSRRYTAPMGAVLATPAQLLGRMLTERGGRALVRKLAVESDENLLIANRYFGTLSKAASWARALVRYEAYLRWPYREGTCAHGAPMEIHHVAKLFGVAENTLFQDVRAARLYADDDTGPPMPASWYREASRGSRLDSLTIARRLFEQGASIRALRQELGRADIGPKKHACPLCGRIHAVMTPETAGPNLLTED